MFPWGWEHAGSQSPAGRVSKQDEVPGHREGSVGPLQETCTLPLAEGVGSGQCGLGSRSDVEAEGPCELGQATTPP